MKKFLNQLACAAMAIAFFLPSYSYAKGKTQLMNLEDVLTQFQVICNQKPFQGGKRCCKSGLSPWIERKDNVFVYKFNFFNLSSKIDNCTLASILNANAHDIAEHYRGDWGKAVDIKLYSVDQLTNLDLFKGDRIPFFIIDTAYIDALSFHSVEASEPAESDSFLYADSAIYDLLGFHVPHNFPYWTPWGAAILDEIETDVAYLATLNNPYAITHFEQFLSYAINHELKEMLTDDSEQNYVVFDNFAPTIYHWHYGEFNSDGECINGTLGPDGYVHLPHLLDELPAGGLFTTLQENCDAVSADISSLLNSYKVNGWSMTNYLTSNFWKGYYQHNDEIKWDLKGYVKRPLQPFAGVFEEILVLDFDTGYTYGGGVFNWGPITYYQRGETVANNFPPDYTVIFFDFLIDSGMQDPKTKKLKALHRSKKKRSPTSRLIPASS